MLPNYVKDKVESNLFLTVKINTHIRLHSYSVYPNDSRLGQNATYEAHMSNTHLREHVVIGVSIFILKELPCDHFHYILQEEESHTMVFQ